MAKRDPALGFHHQRVDVEWERHQQMVGCFGTCRLFFSAQSGQDMNYSRQRNGEHLDAARKANLCSMLLFP
ncbi:hypothetical protein MUK42_36642 [Musa troglodytarum]|uniref:Uncharacterized protein n=1 Tax=Musa troglodytarum TaxID=320322 RepID=A0A9E7FN22_9LILI|nr:hypothetical protein MUK42_36642 [Musa troglodytarum]